MRKQKKLGFAHIGKGGTKSFLNRNLHLYIFFALVFLSLYVHINLLFRKRKKKIPEGNTNKFCVCDKFYINYYVEEIILNLSTTVFKYYIKNLRVVKGLKNTFSKSFPDS